MKKIFFALAFVSVFLLYVFSVTAAASFSISDVDLGSNSQKREVQTTGVMTVTNDGTAALSIGLSSTIPSQYAPVFSQSVVNLAPASSTNVTLTVTVPDSQDAGRNSIGVITATASNGGTITRTSTAYLTAKSELEISKVRVDVDGSSHSVDDGDSVDAKPGSDITISVTVKNTFTEDIEIRDITVNANSDDLDFDDDKDLNDLNHGDKDTVDFSFSIDKDIDQDSYTVQIDVDGVDENGASHSDSRNFDIDVNRESHEISINQFSLNPSVVSCDRKLTANIKIENTGAHDEDEADVVIKNDNLGLAQEWAGIQLDTGETWSKSYSLVVPDSMPAGSYDILITTYYNTNQESMLDAATVTVQSCSPVQPPQQQCTNLNQLFCVDDSSFRYCSPSGVLSSVQYCQSGFKCQNGDCVEMVQPPTGPTGAVTGPSYGEVPFVNTPTYLVILVAVALILVILIVLLLIKFIF